MGTSVDTERKIITELTQLLRNNADKLLSGETKLCLTTSSLGIISANFRRVSDLSEEDERRELEGRGLITRSVNGQLRKKVEEVKLWRDNIRTLQDFVIKTKALKIIHGTYTIKAPVQIARFHSLQVLEVKKVPIHMVEGLSKLRGQLREIIVTRSLQKLQDLFEICGGDRSSGLTWHKLKTAYLSFNGLNKLDSSLKFVPFLEVFDLSHNNLKDTEDCLQNLTYLLRLNLGFNQLTKVPEFSYSLKGLLKTLVLRNNSLDNIEGIEELTALEELDVAHNMLVDHQCLAALSKLRKLMILCLVGNPLTYKMNHRMMTVEYLSTMVAFGHFLLDGQRLNAQETSLLKESHFKKSHSMGSNSNIIIEESPSPANGTLVDTIDSSESMDGSRLSVKSSGSRKKGHKRVPSKERVAVIADIVDGTEQEPLPEKSSPTGSYVEDPKELEKIENEKRKYEIMREHYKDDWLKALLAEQGRLTENTIEEQSRQHFEEKTKQQEGDQSYQQEVNKGTKTTVRSEERMNDTEKPKVIAEKSETEAKIKTDPSSEISEPSKTDQIEEKKQETGSEPSTPLITINPMTDIYALRQVGPNSFMSRAPVPTIRSPEPVVQPQGIEWGRTDSQLEEYYGEESDPFIVMLPDQDMKQLFITVNERYITEKDMFGQKCAMLDLKCLQAKRRSEEILTGKDIIGGLLVPVVTLEFDYVRKDMRQRKYAMEDDSFAQDFEALVDKHIKMKELQTQMKELVECLKCQHQFFKPQQSSSPSVQGLQCPKCKSPMVIELNIRKFDHESTRESQGNSLPTKDKSEEKKRKESQPSPKIQRKKAVKRLEETAVEVPKKDVLQPHRNFSLPDVTVPQMREKTSDESTAERHRSFRNIQLYEEYDTFKENTSLVTSAESVTQSQMKHINSWSDVRTSGSHSVHALPRGSASSVESDIAILATNSSSRGSITAVSESNQEVISNRNKDSVFSDKDIIREPGPNHVTDEKEADWISGGQEQVTPVGSPLTNSVCSSMVSSVYENTLSGAGENIVDADSQDVCVRTVASSLTISSTGSLTVDQTNENMSEKLSNQNIDMQVRSSLKENFDSDVKVLVTSEESISIYDTADSSVTDKIYDTRDTVDSSRENESIPSIYDSVSSESEPKTSSPDNSVIGDARIRRSSWSRRSFKKRSGYYGADQFESSAEVNDTSSLKDKEQTSSHSELDFPGDISPIKRTSINRRSKQEHRSAVIIDNLENLTDDSVSLDISQSQSAASSEIGVSTTDQVNICHSPPASNLPWDQEESSKGETTGGSSRHESFNHDEFVNVDHRLQLYLELKVFTSTENCQCVLHCNIIQYMKPEAIKSLLVISTTRMLLYEVIGDLESDSASDWLKCYEDQPITELQFVDAGLGYQSLRLEFGTDCSSYTLLIMDEGKCKRFLTLLTDIVQTVSLNEHSRLESISKSNPTTLKNLEDQVLNQKDEEPEELVKYLLVQLIDNDDPEKRENRGLAITPTNLILIKVNHQWPLPRLQAPLSQDVKGKQFKVEQKEPINNIETFEFNEYNPTELRLSFFDEGSDAKLIWVIAMETTQGVKALVDAIREPWENEFGVSFDITPVSFSEGEQN